ncbi:MAG: glycoside hydrolase family 3 C-terminal domain-containing protein, partial [Saprospiraceae bacterium]
MKKRILSAVAITGVTILAASAQPFPFRDTTLPFELRARDIVARLSLEEKVGQMLHAAPAIPHLSIPAYNWWNEALHGVARTPFPVTCYPQAIGMAATWDTASLRLMAHFTAVEGRAVHNKATALGRTNEEYLGLTYWTPNVNIFRDPRWGRGQETYGEDPCLTTHMGLAFVSGLQGNHPKYLKAAACAKHFALHSGPEPTRHSDNVHTSDYDLWDTYLPVFRALVTTGGVAGVMCAYNAYRDQPCCANDLLMNEILRKQWGFSGYAVSDCWALSDFFQFHHTHPDARHSALDALLHGTDMECGNSVYTALLEATKSGAVREEHLNTALQRLFLIRLRLGMFDPAHAVPYALTPASALEAPEHRAHALKMARQSIVLLKNENNTLPLRKNLRKIAVIGPNADNATALLGNYHGTPTTVTTVLQGIRDKVGAKTEVWYEKALEFADDTVDDLLQTRFNDLALRTSDADAIIFVGGISPELEGEDLKVKIKGFHGGDRTTIHLPETQTALLQYLKSTGKPIVFVLLTGSAVAIPWEGDNLPAIVNAWYGGQSGGSAVADVLFGDYNPAGRLPVTFYRSDTDLPDFKNYDMANRTYRYFRGQPQYPFGYGLSYTVFRYSRLQLPRSVVSGQPLTVTATVKNAGKMDGEEVVQVYVSHPDWPGRAPVQALKAFRRIALRAGESRTVSFTL